MSSKHNFLEVIKPGSSFDFIGRRKSFLGVSLALVLVSIGIMLANVFFIPSRGSVLNWGVDFKGGTELLVDFSKPVAPDKVRTALAEAGYVGADVVRYGAATQGDPSSLMIRLGAVSIVSDKVAQSAEQTMAKVGNATLKAFDWSEGGDKIYLRFNQDLETAAVAKALKDAGITTTEVKTFGRAEEHVFEATLIGMDNEIRKVLDGALGAGAVKDIPMVESVGAKAGRQLQIGGIKAVIGAILLIVLYVALRFDFRFGPGTIVALLHDVILTLGAFALTYREFSLTTLAAVLTVAGYSVNDTIIVFDRVRENVSRYRDRKFGQLVNQSVNETLSRTILTSLTLLFITLAMNVLGSGVVKDFAFAMNIGVVVGTYSSIFIASPILIWLNDTMVARHGRGAKDAGKSNRGGQTAIV